MSNQLLFFCNSPPFVKVSQSFSVSIVKASVISRLQTQNRLKRETNSHSSSILAADNSESCNILYFYSQLSFFLIFPPGFESGHLLTSTTIVQFCCQPKFICFAIVIFSRLAYLLNNLFRFDINTSCVKNQFISPFKKELSLSNILKTQLHSTPALMSIVYNNNQKVRKCFFYVFNLNRASSFVQSTYSEHLSSYLCLLNYLFSCKLFIHVYHYFVYPGMVR